MNYFRPITFAISLILPSILPAQTLLEQLASAPKIPFQEWLEMTAGKTVVYEIGGETYAYEAYSRINNSITIQLETGACIDGTWFMQETAYCFDWEIGVLNCFNHKRLNGDIYVVGLENGLENIGFQKVSRIASLPLTCGPALLSQLEPEATP